MIPYYLLYSVKFWLCVIAAVAIAVFIKNRLNIKPFWRAAPQGDDTAKGPQRLDRKEVRRLEKEAAAGNADAQIKLGDALYNGTGVKRNQKKAVEWYLRAADLEHADAFLKLGDVFSKGAYAKEVVFDEGDPTENENDILKNEGEALRWYIKGAQKGIPRAQKRLTEAEARLQESFLAPIAGDDVKVAEVACGEPPNGYQAFLTAKGLNIFQEASELPELRRKKGEDFTAALLKRGGILKVERHTGSWFTDGAKGEPAVQVFNEEGACLCIMHYKDNRLHDAADGTPAFQVFSKSGKPLRISHFKNGQRHDGAKGDAAFLLFSDDGHLLWAVHYKDDQVIKALSEHEIATYFETARITQSIEKALPGLKIH